MERTLSDLYDRSWLLAKTLTDLSIGVTCRTLAPFRGPGVGYLMAKPPVNNRQHAQRVDGRTASNSELNNGRQNGRNHASSSRCRSFRRETTQIPSPQRAVSQTRSPRRIASQIHILARNRDHRSAYDIMGIVTGQLGCLDRLKSNYARQREVEQELRQEQAWRKETEEKLRKMEAKLKRKAANKATLYHSDLLFTTGDPFSEEIMQAEVPKNFNCLEMALYDGSTDPMHHLSNFRSRMYLAGASDATRCKGFPTTLTKAA
ncbi:hypothetical protein PIB30_054051 [Stylosanthes scabra]|uniref:Uncharacterized protein n=1 Tax=Stylosanthes scabra TaxID=79078 RepID=A0ABU6TIG3_9FABA|nr:hypothetical protein [Stylosanthes scabra]